MKKRPSNRQKVQSAKKMPSARRPTGAKSGSTPKRATGAKRTVRNSTGNARLTVVAKVSETGNPFHQRLGSLTYSQACQLLGSQGAALLREGDQLAEIELDRDVYFGGDLLRIRVQDSQLSAGLAITTITLQSTRRRQLLVNCDQCDGPCRHLGAALHYLLDSKTALGLAVAPDESVPLEHLTREELLQRVLADRQKRAANEKMVVRSTHPDRPWADYVVTSQGSGRSYRVSVRGFERGQSFCSCADFRTNLLETCKHLIHVQTRIRKRFTSAQLAQSYRRTQVSLRVSYGNELGVIFNLPHEPDAKIRKLVGTRAEKPTRDMHSVMKIVTALERGGQAVTVFPDAAALMERELTQERLRSQCDEIRQNVAAHPLRQTLLKTTLLPYQLEGIIFCVSAGRAILADDMGLGKTIQAIGVAELLARLADIRRVLIVCPASLKSQWRNEIHRFSDRSTQLVVGSGAERARLYAGETFFTICNYEQVVRDLTHVEAIPWDLIVLDEGQRIKNWESKTSATIRQLESTYRLVLSGTPLENRLGELYTVVKFVDEHRLGPAYEFFHRHHVVDERGKTLGYQKLDELRTQLSPILLRRKRSEVIRQLPERTDELVRIEPTAEQSEICFAQMRIAAQIVAKKFITEMDLLRLQKALLMARMACDSTFLIDQEEPEYSSKLERLTELLEGLLPDPTRKIVVFSEWRRMLDRIERRLVNFGVQWVRLDGQVPQKRRGALVARFQNDPACRLILMTNAGSTGLNLQSANTVINVDLPWNPAVLEQRIARAHRMGQKNPVHIYKLVTTGDTIEERMLTTLANKQELANAALDLDSDISQLVTTGGMENLKKQLEVVLTDPVPPPIDESQLRRVTAQTEQLQQRREKVAEVSGQLISAALSLAGELLAADPSSAADERQVAALTERLSECAEIDEQGRPQLKITLHDAAAIRSLAVSLARLMP